MVAVRKAPDFRVGDRVVVSTRIATDDIGWSEEMDGAIGTIGTITSVDKNMFSIPVASLCGPGLNGWTWPLESLVFSKEMHARDPRDVASDPEGVLVVDPSEPLRAAAKPSALDVQISGDHYKGTAIQPIEYIHANGIPFAEGCVIKYVSRWRKKGGIRDLEKARHFIDLLIELESKK